MFIAYQKYQNHTLDTSIEHQLPVIIHLANKVHFKGRVLRYDNFTILLQTEKSNLLIYKHSIVTLYLLRSFSGGTTGKKK